MLVEDGSGIADANSYASEAAADAYCGARGITPAAGDMEAALVVGSAFIDGRYRSRYPGVRVHGRAQGLEWPRFGATDRSGFAVPGSEVPREIVEAAIIAALQHLASPGSLYPVASGSSTAVVKREKFGPMEVEYDTSTAEIVGAISLTEINDLLAGLLEWGGAMVAVLRA